MSTDASNKTKYSDDHLNYCGAHFCYDLDLTNLTGNGNSSSAGSGSIIEPPAVELVRLLCGILLGFALLATVLIALFVDPLTEYCNTNSSFIQLRKLEVFLFFKDSEKPLKPRAMALAAKRAGGCWQPLSSTCAILIKY